MDPVWRAIKHDKWFTFETPEGDQFDEFVLYLAQFAPGTELDIIVRKRRKAASNPQMRYYYGVICKLLSDWSGHSVEEMDSYLKWTLLKETDENGIDYVPSKTSLSTAEFEDYCENARIHAAVVLEVTIPLPNEVDYATQESSEEG